MELFDIKGHLTDAALKAVIAEKLDELSRLEAAEHLSFCDDCLVRYTNMLTDDILLTPQNPIAPPLISRLRQKAVLVFFNKYTTMAAAVALAVVFWSNGFFTGLIPAITKPDAAQNEPQRVSISEKANDFLHGATNALNEFVGGVRRPEKMK